MSLTRKRKRELKRLRGSAEELWEQQQLILDRANAVAREASRQVSHLTREEVAPRVREGYEHYVRPGVENARGLARQAGRTFEKTVIPAVGTALGTAMSVADIAKDARVKAAAERFGDVRKSLVKKAAPQKSGPGAGTYVALGFAAAAAVGLAYAVWQTFRADDELWVADEEPTTPTTPTTSTADPLP